MNVLEIFGVHECRIDFLSTVRFAEANYEELLTLYAERIHLKQSFM